VIRQTFIETVSHYSHDEVLVNSLWSEIEKNYSSKSRHYHNLNHLDFLLQELAEVKSHLLDWDTIIFAIVYHDLIYHALKKNNEEKSAEIASERLDKIGYAKGKINLCVQMIQATSKHSLSTYQDINFFTDADLAILGKDESTYRKYTAGVRKEYSVYPDIIYRPGRRQVLQHFLEMEKIFKTQPFFDKYEKQARNNLQIEMLQLK